MWLLLAAFLLATFAFAGLTRMLWLYEVRVHGAPAPALPGTGSHGWVDSGLK